MMRRALVIAGMVLGCGAQPSGPVVTVGQVTAVTLPFAPVVFADALGYFHDEGLKLQILEFDGSATLLPQLVTGRVLIGYPDPDAILLSTQPGHQRIPLTFFYNMCRRSVWEFAVLVKSPITSIDGLRGKRLGVGSLAWAPLVFTRAVLEDHGLVEGRDVTFVPVGIGASAFHALTTGQIDALNLYDTEHATMEASGTALRHIPLGEPYADLISNGFVARQSTVRDSSALLAAFGRAVAKGTVACAANMPACIETFWRRYPEQRPRGLTGDTATAWGLHVLRSRYDKYLAFPTDTPRQFGAYPPGAFRAFAAAIYRGGQSTTPDLPVDSVFTNALVDRINAFDSVAVANQAHAMR